MTFDQAAYRAVIEPRGPAVLRTAEGAYPEGYRTAGSFWAVKLPPEVLASDMTHDSVTGQFLCADQDDAAAGLVRLRGFWLTARARLLPDLMSSLPRAAGGLVPRTALLPLTVEAGRSAQIEAYRLATNAGAGASAAHDGIGLMLRQVQIMTVPSVAQLRVWHAAPGHWAMQMQEAGPLECLLDGAFLLPAAKGEARRMTIGAKAGTPPLNGISARVVALLRAVQLAHIWSACWTQALPRLDVEVFHTGLSDQALRLTIAPEGWGLPLARLAQDLHGVLEDEAEPMWKARDGVDLSWRLVPPATPEELTWRDHWVPEPVAWQSAHDSVLPRWTYAGTAHADLREVLPFAVTPDGPFPPDEQHRFLAWLAGERRSEGLRPGFAMTYLQGLEYRLLKDTAPAPERAALVAEIKAIANLADEALLDRARHLIDWLGATDRRSLVALSDEGPICILIATARRVADGRALEVDDLCALASLCLGEDTDLGEGFRAALLQIAPEGLRLAPPKVQLAAHYASLGGELDEARRSFLHKDKPLSDLRASARLRHVLGLAQSRVRATAAPGEGPTP